MTPLLGPVGGYVDQHIIEIRSAVRHSDETRGYKLTHILARYQLGLLDRGPDARPVACIECGVTDFDETLVAALAWRTSDRANLRLEGGKIWSIQIDDYDPMCRSCHRSYDQAGWSEAVGIVR